MTSKRGRVCVFGEGGVCQQLRLNNFLDGNTEHDIVWERLREFSYARIPDFDLFVFQRDISEQSIALHRAVRAAGRGSIFEIDDLLWDLPGHSDFIVDAKIRAVVLEHLRLASAVTTSTEPLGAFAREYNPRVHVILNSPPVLKAKRRLFIASLDALKLGEFRLQFARVVSEAVRAFDLQLWLAGGVDAKLFYGEPVDSVRIAVCRPAVYHDMLSAAAPDLALVPLDTSPYALCKSDVKVLDFAAHGIPAIYSNVDPYATTVAHAVTGWLADNAPLSWADAIQSALADTAQLARMKTNLRALHARETARQQVGRDTWRGILSELTAA